MFHRLFAGLFIIGLLAGSLVLAQTVDVDDDEIEITGVVQALGDGTITIGGLVIDISGAEIKGVIVVGEIVKVHVSLDDAGGFVAREAEVRLNADDDDDDGTPAPASTPDPSPDDDDSFDDDSDDRREGEFEIVGTVTEVGDGFIVINGQTIQIDTAEIKNEPVVGARVKVHLRNQDGTLIAREVENNDDDDDDDRSSSSDDWNVIYTVRPGDTLSSIAARARTTVEEIARVNNITDIRFVVAGTTLTLPNIPFRSDDDDDDDSSGRGSSSLDDDDDDDNSGRGSSNSGSGSSRDDDDDDDDDRRSSNSGSSNDDDDDGGDSDDDD